VHFAAIAHRADDVVRGTKKLFQPLANERVIVRDEN
jgi:hypothetical protein